MHSLLILLYTISSVLIDGHSAYLLSPEEDSLAQHPAVLLLHDHGAHFSIGKEKLCTPLDRDDLSLEENAVRREDAHSWVNKFYDGMFLADSLASEGFVVLVTDALYWGERTTQPVPFTSLQELKPFNKLLKSAQPDFYAAHLRATGKPWFETILQDDRNAISYLCSLSSVDTTRIYAAGFSLGAYRAWSLAAEDPRVAGCAAANWMMTAASVGGFLINESAYSMYRPALYATSGDSTSSLSLVDYPMIAARIAPRPFLLLYSMNDPVCPLPGVLDAIFCIGKAYNESDVPVFSFTHPTESPFVVAPFPGVHFFSHDHYLTLLHWLKSL